MSRRFLARHQPNKGQTPMTVSAQMVKELRDATGASVLDCKKALEEHDGDINKAKEYLTEKGLATAAKKAGREANEGVIETYTHPGGRVGVMLELNCETDFVGRTPRFTELAHELALHIAFANPSYLDVNGIPAAVLDEQRQAFTAEAKAQGKPDNVVERIVEGRLNKFYSEVCLMKQPFVKDDEKTVQDVVTEAIAELKENIRVSRFIRYELSGSGDAE
jgi:elongation factor Ts